MFEKELEAGSLSNNAAVISHPVIVTPMFWLLGQLLGVKRRNLFHITFFRLRGLESCGEFFWPATNSVCAWKLLKLCAKIFSASCAVTKWSCCAQINLGKTGMEFHCVTSVIIVSSISYSEENVTDVVLYIAKMCCTCAILLVPCFFRALPC